MTNESNIIDGDFKYPRLEDYKKFAELIVRECCNIVVNCGIPGSNTERDFVVASREIRHYFGVEE
jgi:hypothetical protein